MSTSIYKSIEGEEEIYIYAWDLQDLFILRIVKTELMVEATIRKIDPNHCQLI